jgi:ankyrin repeat protein
VWGYIHGKNRKFEDWLPAVNDVFLDYDDLVRGGKIRENHIRWENYNQKSLHVGLSGLQDVVRQYNRDKRNYKVVTQNGTVDFSEHRDEIDVQEYRVDGDVLKIIIPRSREASVYWGWDTKWCTARIDKREPDIFRHNMFTHYYNLKNPSGSVSDLENDNRWLYILQFNGQIKYQLHFAETQIMDTEDVPVTDLLPTEERLITEWLSNTKFSSVTDIQIVNLFDFSPAIMKYMIQNRVFPEDYNPFVKGISKPEMVKFWIDMGYQIQNNGDLENSTTMSVVRELVKYGGKIYSDFIEHTQVPLLDISPEDLQFLVEHGANFKSPPYSGDILVILKRVDSVKYILSLGVDVNSYSSGGVTGIFYRGNKPQDIEITTALIEAGADVNITGGQDEEPAIFNVYGLKMLQLFIRHGSRLDAVDSNGRTILHRYIEEDVHDQEYADFLLRSGVDINARDHLGNTPLHTYSNYSNDFKIVEWFITNGADLEARNVAGNTPILRGVEKSKKAHGYKTLRSDSNFVQWLVKKGADYRVKNNRGENLVWCENPKVVEYAVRSLHLDVDSPNNKGTTPLHRAVKESNPRLTKKLLKLGANYQGILTEAEARKYRN